MRPAEKALLEKIETALKASATLEEVVDAIIGIRANETAQQAGVTAEEIRTRTVH